MERTTASASTQQSTPHGLAQFGRFRIFSRFDSCNGYCRKTSCQKCDVSNYLLVCWDQGALPVGSALVAAALNQAGWGGLFSSLQGPQAPPPQQDGGPGGPGNYPGMNAATAAATAQQHQQAIASVGMPVPAPNTPGGGASGLLGWGESPGPVAVTTPNSVGVQQPGNPQSQQQPGMAPWGQRDASGPKGPPYTMKYD